MIRAAFIAMFLWAGAANAQGTSVALGGVTLDSNAPVEVAADSLKVDQATGSATFSGNVLIGQGDMRIRADAVEVFYSEASGDIDRLVAAGTVTFVTPTEAVASDAATYDIAAGLLTLEGNVLLSQGNSALTSDRMTVNLNTNTAQMEGRVRTTIQTNN